MKSLGKLQSAKPELIFNEQCLVTTKKAEKGSTDLGFESGETLDDILDGTKTIECLRNDADRLVNI